MWVPSEPLVGHQNVGSLTRQVLVDVGEDRRPVPKWQAAAPALARADDLQAICDAAKGRLARRRPDALAKDPAQTRHLEPADLDDAAVKVTVCKFRAK